MVSLETRKPATTCGEAASEVDQHCGVINSTGAPTIQPIVSEIVIIVALSFDHRGELRKSDAGPMSASGIKDPVSWTCDIP
jgi:hypothetical protein